MPIYIYILKVLHKLNLSRIMFPIFYVVNKYFHHNKLPSIFEARQIIRNYDYKTYKYVNHKGLSLLHDKHDKKYDLQIIIPVYNSEKYIRKCLNSVLFQRTSYRFKIIVVNDGSTDDTTDILRMYDKYPLVKIINQHNCGRASARNRGLDYANNCNYVMFVDSDDVLAPNSIQCLLHNAYSLKSDISFGSYGVFNNKIIKYMYVPYKDQIYLKSSDDINGYLWGKIFKRTLFSGIKFPRGYEFEDTVLAFWIYPKCKKISSISQCVYYYRDNPKSISHTFKNNNVSIDSFLITKLLVINLSNVHIKYTRYIYNTFLAQVKMNCLRNNYMNVDIQKSIFVLTHELLEKYFCNFSTNIKSYKYLEESINNNNYNNYLLSCILR